MQIAHAADSAQITSIRGKEREFKTLLTGEEGALDNFRLYFVRQLGAVDIPRHKHNFDQIRVCLEGGPQNFGAGKWIAPGELAYFPEGTAYGPEQSNTDRLSLTFQFGGASRNGFVGSKRLHEAMEEMKAYGTFEKGMFTRRTGQTRAQDSFEAIWEHLNNRELVYPRARYGEAILIKPQNFEWEAQRDQSGLAKKRLCVFSERQLSIEVVKVDAGGARDHSIARRRADRLRHAGRRCGQRRGVAQILGVLRATKSFVLSSQSGLEVLLVGLPIFAVQPSLMAAE